MQKKKGEEIIFLTWVISKLDTLINDRLVYEFLWPLVMSWAWQWQCLFNLCCFICGPSCTYKMPQVSSINSWKGGQHMAQCTIETQVDINFSISRKHNQRANLTNNILLKIQYLNLWYSPDGHKFLRGSDESCTLNLY